MRLSLPRRKSEVLGGIVSTLSPKDLEKADLRMQMILDLVQRLERI